MSDHIDRKRAVLHAKRHKGLDNEDIRLVLSRCAIKDEWRTIAEMILVKEMDENCVGDLTGYSRSQIKRIYSATLAQFCAVAEKLHKI